MEFKLAERNEEMKEDDEILKLEEVAAQIKSSVKTARRRIESGVLRGFKEGGRVCVLKSDLREYLARTVQATASR